MLGWWVNASTTGRRMMQRRLIKEQLTGKGLGLRPAPEPSLKPLLGHLGLSDRGYVRPKMCKAGQLKENLTKKGGDAMRRACIVLNLT